MADLFEFPEMPREQRSIRLFRTPFPKDPEKSAPKVAKRFGVTGKARDAGARLVFSSQRSNLELFRASDSLRWSEMGKLKSEDDGAGGLARRKDCREKRRRVPERARARPGQPASAGCDLGGALGLPPRHDQAGNKAGRHPRELSLRTRSACRCSDRARRPVSRSVARRRCSSAITSGAPPRKRANVPFFRRPYRGDFRNDEAYAELDSETARVSVRSAQFGYYALPPREYQGMLIPVCAVSGTVSTRVLPRYDFLRYVVAVDFADNDAKELGVVTSRLPRIIN